MADEENQPLSLAYSGAGEGATPGSQWKRTTIEEKIAAHKLELIAAENQVQRLRQIGYELDELLNSTSPIMSLLSWDALIHIFALVCDSEEKGRKPLPVQFLIGAVCRQWRRIAWATPHLWKNISIYFTRDGFGTQESLVQQWIERTAHSPLYIRLNHAHGEWEPPVAFFIQLLKTCHRWISFEYLRPSLNFQFALSHEANSNFPLLKSLEVYGIPKAPGGLNQWQFNSPPELRSLSFLAQRDFYLAINWATLDVINAVLNLQGSVNLLGLLGSPESLLITIIPSRPHTAMPVKAPYHLQRLASLVVDGETALVSSLLTFITAPALKVLSVDFKEDHSDHPWIDDFTAFVGRSSFKLTKLTLHQTSIASEAAIFHMLLNIPSLERLDLDCASPFTLSDPSISQLNSIASSSGGLYTRYLPNLTFFAYRGDISFSLDTLFAMMKGRIEYVQELRIEITYLNHPWYQNKNPNTIHRFYTDVASLQGVVLTLEWDSILEESDVEME
ncbi:hypothetical protein GALMADRAFT_428208 [Galerina marginata CBS 339.88]|uniref:Uncharacterized protein n=1 Tax=Galerina marginata (strain CBS 339.88) TaxID=685588 RepID=A0A067TDN2_GALM3|nr:hypothetical protein GALMADRAFT_428208 [Galerina marginata CBS 339.88]